MLANFICPFVYTMTFTIFTNQALGTTQMTKVD